MSVPLERKKNSRYPRSIRLEVVELFITGQKDKWELLRDYQISDYRRICSWKEKHEAEVRARLSGKTVIQTITEQTRPKKPIVNETFQSGHYPKRYRLEVVEAYLRGDMDMWELQEEYNIPRSEIIRSWVKRHESEIRERLSLNYDVFSPIMTSEEKEENKISALEEEIRRLKSMLSQSNLKAEALETLIDLAEKTYELPIRKNFAAKQSKKYKNDTHTRK